MIDNKNNNKEFSEKLVYINRLSKTVKGGRIFSFSSIIIIGNHNGKVGFGYGKSKEIPISIQKSINNAYKNIIYIKINKNKTIYNEIFGKYVCSKVFIKPTNVGTGIKASNTLRTIFKLSGIENISTKIYGSNNIINVIKDTFKALKNLKNIEYILKKRNLNINNILS